MIRVAIFTEGQSELIFTRELLLNIFEYQNISLLCLRLHSGSTHEVPYSYSVPVPKFYFQIVDVGSDSKLISYIGETHSYILSKDFDLIIGLRDLYSEEYEKRSTKIDRELIQLFIETQTQVLRQITGNYNQIKLFFAIMEFEAWLLSMPNLFSKIHPSLTAEFINDYLGYDLKNISPQREFYHPANQVTEILGLVEIKYNKSKNQMESIVSKISAEDIDNALETGKCPAFVSYYSELFGYRDQIKQYTKYTPDIVE